MDDNSPLELVERAATLVSEELLATLQKYILENWASIAEEIASHKESAAFFFNEDVISLCQIYSDSTSLFVRLDERADQNQNNNEEENVNQIKK